MKAYSSATTGEGAWLGGGTPVALGGGSSLSAPRYGTSPGGHSDISNEAQIHGGLTETTANFVPSDPPSPNATYVTQPHQSDLPSSSYPGVDADPAILAATLGLSTVDMSDGRPSIQSMRSSIDPPTIVTSSIPAYDDPNESSNRAGFIVDSSSNDSVTASRLGHTSYASSSQAPPTSSTSFGDGGNGLTTYSANVADPTASTSTSSNSLSQLNPPPADEVVPTSFDESILRALCEVDCAMPLLFDRIKQSMVSTREASAFLKKRASIEEEYAKSLSKLSRSTLETYSISDGKAGTYVNSWQNLMKTHDSIAENRLRFASKLSEMSDELSNLAKEVDKNRKQTRETGVRLEKNLQEAEAGVEKARSRFDTTAEDLERLLLLKSGESAKGGELHSVPGGKRTLGKAIGKSGLLFKNKNPQQILKQEEEIRARTSSASDAFRKEVLSTQGMRQEYFNLQLPRILRSLKESAEEIDNGTQYHLARYAFLFESTVLNDGMVISPVGANPNSGVGLKGAVEAIDNRTDFKQYMQNYQVVHGRDYKGPKREGPYEEGFLPSTNVGINKAMSERPVSNRPIFGIDLTEQMARDNVDVPPILEKCVEAIEAVGITNMGIYRLSGTTSKIQKLKAKFDADWSAVDLPNDEAINDINIVAGCLKLWFRELPEPLMTHELYHGFIDAAKVENDRLRHIRLHERVNELPDANYATLKYLMGHLDKVKSQESINQMSGSNLAIVFGPTLLSPPPPGEAGIANGGGMYLQDMNFQCRAIETILEKYREIFVDENE